MRRDSPFVNVYAASENTVVHIRQMIYKNGGKTPSESEDGIVMPLIEFRSLMFHLRALDAQFTQGAAIAKCNANVKEEQQLNERHDDKKEQTIITNSMAGQKRAWHEMNNDNACIDGLVLDAHDDLNNVQNVNDVMKPFEQEKSGDVAENNFATGECAWASLEDMFATFAPSDAPLNVAPHVPVDATYVPTAIIKKMSEANVRDELANVYAEEVIAALPQIVKNACEGCMNGFDKNTTENEHEVCTLPRKARINLFAEKIILSANDSSIRDKLSARLQSRKEVFDEKWMYADRNVLLNNKKWMRKMKKHALDM